MPRIAFILPAFYADHIGGAERQVQILANHLRNEGWEIVYICERSADHPNKEIHEGIEVLALPQRKRRSAWLNHFTLKKAMTESRVDIFYQRIRHPYTGMAAFHARKMRKPFIFAVASIADVIRDKNLRRSSQAGNPLDLLLHPLNRYIEDFGILKADAIICQTKEQSETLQKHYDRNGTIIPNHIITNNESITSKKVQPEILWLSNIKPFKRPELFIELARRCSDLQTRFVMAGLCQDQYIYEIIRQADDELDNFTYIGPLDPSDADKNILEATLLVNTSEFEGFPNSFQQAWAGGVPTLSLGVDPDGVIQRESMGGCAASLGELERMVRDFIDDGEKLRRTGGKARIFACQNYDISLLLPRYLELFNNIMT